VKDYNITILLTIYNRIDYTKKWLDFAEKQKIPFKILISDGGNVKNVKKKLKLNKRKLDIKYKKYKYYKNFKKIYEKYFFAIQNVKTDYLIICEDDDYLSVDGFIKSARFLSKNKNFSCAKGMNLLGDLVPSKSFFSYYVLRKQNNSCDDFSILNNSPADRLVNFYKYQNLTFYNGLQRTAVIKKIFQILNKDFFNLWITELIFNLYLVYKGKIKRFNYIDYIKMDNTQLSSSYNFGKFRKFSNIIKSSRYNFENNLVIKYFKFKKKFNVISALHNNFIIKNENARLLEEKRQSNLLVILLNYFREFLQILGIKHILKYFLYNFRCKSISRAIYIKDKNVFFSENDKLLLKKIYEFNSK